jgi:hypothetical protein
LTKVPALEFTFATKDGDVCWSKLVIQYGTDIRAIEKTVLEDGKILKSCALKTIIQQLRVSQHEAAPSRSIPASTFVDIRYTLERATPVGSHCIVSGLWGEPIS